MRPECAPYAQPPHGGGAWPERDRTASSASSLHSTLSSFGRGLGAPRRVGAREEAELRLRGVLAAQRALAAALAARHAALTKRLAAAEADVARLQAEALSGGAARRAPPAPGASPLRGGDMASQAAFLAEVRSRAAAAHAAAAATAEAALAARLRGAAAEGVDAKLREAHPTTATAALRRRLETEAHAAMRCRMRVEAHRRDRTQLDRAALLQQQARRAACLFRSRACDCVPDAKRRRRRAWWSARSTPLRSRRRSARPSATPPRRSACAPAARGCVSPLHRRRFALMLLNNHDATQARSVMYVLGPGGAPSPAQMHAQDAADAAGDALQALRSLRS